MYLLGFVAALDILTENCVIIVLFHISCSVFKAQRDNIRAKMGKLSLLWYDFKVRIFMYCNK